MLAWQEAITLGRDWQEERDVPRIRQAFSILARSRRQWPAVPDFLDALPRIEAIAIPRQVFTEAQLKANRERLGNLIKDMGKLLS